MEVQSNRKGSGRIAKPWALLLTLFILPSCARFRVIHYLEGHLPLESEKCPLEIKGKLPKGQWEEIGMVEFSPNLLGEGAPVTEEEFSKMIQPKACPLGTELVVTKKNYQKEFTGGTLFRKQKLP